jgi:hypothetical protein
VKTDYDTENRTFEIQKPKPNRNTEKTEISVRFGKVRFGFRFMVKKCPPLPTMKEWTMPKLEGEKEGELVRLPYHYKFKKYFKAPRQEWLETIKVMSTEILGNYSKKEDQLMIAAFGTQPK